MVKVLYVNLYYIISILKYGRPRLRAVAENCFFLGGVQGGFISKLRRAETLEKIQHLRICIKSCEFTEWLNIITAVCFFVISNYLGRVNHNVVHRTDVDCSEVAEHCATAVLNKQLPD
jgi:hypothetical protein